MNKQYVLDLSGHNGAVDFQKVKAAGISAVMLKCSEGDSYLAPKFRPNYAKAREAGLSVGAYHFFRGCTPEQAQREGSWFGRCCQGLDLDLGLALDIEAEGVNWDGAKVTAEQAATMVQIFAKAAAAYGRPELEQEKALWLYGGKDYFLRFLNSKELQAYPRWLANPAALDFKPAVKMIQYSWNGTVEGVEKVVDLNLYLETSKSYSMASLSQEPREFWVAVESGYHISGYLGDWPLNVTIQRK